MESEPGPSERPESTASSEPEGAASEESASESAESAESQSPAEGGADDIGNDSAPQQMQRSVPSAANTAAVQVRVGGSRTSSGVDDVAGVQLGLYSSLTATRPVNLDWAVCTSTPEGICAFDVPGTASGEENRTRPLFVRAYSAPKGYTSVTSLATGTVGAVASSTYGFPVGEEVRVCTAHWGSWCFSSRLQWQVHGGKTYTPLTSPGSGSDGVFPVIRENPELPDQCGLDIAVILDFSSSMRDSENALARTTTTLVNELEGTPSSVSLYNFGSSSPAASVSGQPNRTQQQSVASRAGANTVRSWYSQWDLGSWPWQRVANFRIPQNTEGRNWDRGLYAPAASGKSYDAAVLLTDGNPTFHGSPSGNGNQTSFENMEHAIFSANALKAQGVHVLAAGAGTAEIANSASRTNLDAVSGGGAAIQNSSFDAAAQTLASTMARNCQNSVSVVKQVIPEGRDLSQAVPSAGWELSAESSGMPLTRAGSSAPAASRVTGVTNSDGAFEVDLNFSGERAGTTDLSFRETPRSGFTLEQVDGRNARCTDGSGRRIPVSNVEHGFTLNDVGVGVGISCVLVNRELPPAASVIVEKTWLINGTEYDHGAQPEGIDAELAIYPADDTEKTSGEASWGEEHEGHFAGDQVQIKEDVQLSDARSGCRLTSAQVTSADGKALDPAASLTGQGYRSSALGSGITRFAVTNTVECEQRLTLTQDILGGAARSSDWALSIYSTPQDPGAGTRLFSADEGSLTASVEAEATYQLAATGGPAVYVQDDERTDPSRSPMASGSWKCVQTDDQGEALGSGMATGGAEGTVRIPLGGSAECTASSRTAQLTLLPHVINNNQGALLPEDFELRAESELGATALTAGPVTGDGTRTEDSTVLVRPGLSYSVAAQTVEKDLAFRRGELQRYLGDPDPEQPVDHRDDQLWETVSGDELQVAADRHETYRLISYDLAPSILPQTGGLGTLPYLLGGAALIALAALAALRLRNPSQNHGGRAS
ncbi:hypothetical protein I2485_11305 [Nesterenkonia sp. E16_7]|uniref:hypothetical protein n=1 Tax=unclassified Nesterenkonia TaxID=2629769 RepID=UPI001A921818|nr:MULTISPECIES: hypothetical protein [unclassified Nesterenkonia]MBO0595323.1 hypothetical protein [Nesterenkonia sp. E16_10]MBO0599229.1 hypothetical protein [Nesterenkonia sp. E16_7]